MRVLFLQTIIGPLAGTVIGLVFARFGMAGREKLQEFYLKRIELIEKLLLLEPTVDQVRPNTINRSALCEELADIVNRIRLMSLTLEDQAQLEFHKQPLYKRLWKLPKPQTSGGWFATIVFYLYAFTGLFYLVLFFINTAEDGLNRIPLKIVLITLVSSFVVAWIARYAAIRSAQSAVILQRARRQLLESPASYSHAEQRGQSNI